MKTKPNCIIMVKFLHITSKLILFILDGFQTDSQISNSVGSNARSNGENNMRELQKWVPDEDETGEVLATDIDLDENGPGNERHWAAEDMFKKNETKYGVQSTYNPNLEGYTVQLAKSKDSADYRYVYQLSFSQKLKFELLNS